MLREAELEDLEETPARSPPEEMAAVLVEDKVLLPDSSPHKAVKAAVEVQLQTDCPPNTAVAVADLTASTAVLLREVKAHLVPEAAEAAGERTDLLSLTVEPEDHQAVLEQVAEVPLELQRHPQRSEETARLQQEPNIAAAVAAVAERLQLSIPQEL